jgi:hypothetical protein
MAVSNIKISDTINWAKRLCFNHNPVIGNSLEPALTSANLVLQTLLSPPFYWWWNTEDLTFITSTTAPAATSTSSTISAAGVLTVTAANSFGVGASLLVAGFTGTLAPLNGQLVAVGTVIGTFPNYTGFTAQVSFGALGPDVSSGMFTSLTTQDYVVAPPAGYNAAGGATQGWFSHIEHASVYDVSSTTPRWVELTTKNNLSLDSATGRSTFLSPESEDANGNLTFRVMPSPDEAYPISIHAMLTPPQITSVNQTWAPLPDYLQNVYSLGFLSYMLAFNDDPRASMYNSQFKAALLARQDGLTQEEKDIFLNNFDMLTARQMMAAQQGNQARAV